jgi:prophage antirepressor-like protein
MLKRIKGEDNMNALTMRFQNTDFRIVEADGQKWITANALSSGLGYKKAWACRKLIAELTANGELREGSHFRLLPLETLGGVQKTVVLSHRGVIRVCMRSDAPHAGEFRDWAETVLYEVMITGQYNSPVLTQILNQLNETVMLQGNMLNNLMKRMSATDEWRAQTFIPAQTDNSFWPTPTQRLKVLVHKDRLPPRFNSGGSFDWYASKRHAALRGGLLSIRDRRKQKKMPDCVIEPCPENDQFLREAFKAWLGENPTVQQTLRLLPTKCLPKAQNTETFPVQ